MFKQEMKQIVRGLRRQVATSTMNIFGLVIGFTFVILVGIYAFSEMNFDRFHENREAIYRVELSLPDLDLCTTPGIMSSWIKGNIPGVVHSTRILNDEEGGMTERNIVYNQTKYKVDNPLVVDADFFSMFSFGILSGEVRSFYTDKYSVALSKSLAGRVFGKENPIGKTIEYKGEMFTVRAIMDEIPQNSSIRFDMLLPAANMPGYVTTGWGNNTVHTFFQADEFSTYDQLQQKLSNGMIAVFNSLGAPEVAKSRSYHLNPLAKIYYSPNSHDNLCAHGNRKITLMLLTLVLIVLLIALLNYANTILSRATESIKKIGIRSVNGSSRANNVRFLVYQAIVPSTIAVIFAFIISYLLKNILGNFLNISIPDLKFSYFLIALSVGILTGIVVGLFPALKFTSYKITSSLKESNNAGRKLNRLGNVFSIAQFAASIVLIISVFTIYKQMNFVFSESRKNLAGGAVIYMPVANRSPQTAPNIKLIEETLKQLPEIKNVSTSLHMPGDEHYSDFRIPLLKNGEEMVISTYRNMVGVDYPDVMDFEIAEGRFFDSDIKSDYMSYIVNESLINKYNIDDISKVTLDGAPIIGVIKDFHYNSLHNTIEPLAICYEESYQSRIVIKLASANTSLTETIKKIINTTDKIDNAAITDVYFLDQHIAKLYEKEIQVSNILFALALFSILISGMGLFSMSMLISKMRTKEIGIRKVNGAKISEILAMLNKDFIKWVAIAFVVACPIAYYAMNKWLENFAYKTTLSWWIFALAGVLALGIALLTVSWQSWRAATRNPVEALRYE
ncbi:ABC transporter permease [Draconibacterium halophilum]|uniref:FtsX-like permease family protein n=1 Tax=Draconibacterium halophilum TaxID=2706887 RepID=A0A6C0R882_9BACT|nr:ABC transporter permease [Draconibacterium halophilum]QIA06594.1 FtsX-like permease family protein [Draconibacterium halophilum]